MGKQKSQAQIDKERDQHLLKTYGRGLDWYNAELEKNGGGCAVCGAKGVTRSLPLDHDHKHSKVKIKTAKRDDGTWIALAVYLKTHFQAIARKRNDAVREIKGYLKAASCRGVLCFAHNAGLQKFSDRPDWLRAAADYLERHQNGENV